MHQHNYIFQGVSEKVSIPEKRAESEGQTSQTIMDILNAGKTNSLRPSRPQRDSTHISAPLEPQGHKE